MKHKVKEGLSSLVSSPWLYRLAVLVVAAWLGFRITRAVDLSDEAYYAVFLDDWLKEGIEASPFLVLHQTAALLLYPATLMFRWATGATDGLILFLRVLYVVGAGIAAISVGMLLGRLGMQRQAWLAAAMVLAFIPFGLPAPSYNTVGEQATMVALASIGGALIERPRRVLWLLCSGAAWAVATVAHPAMFFVLGTLLLLLFVLGGSFRVVLPIYGVIVASGQAVAWGCVIAVLTPSRIVESIAYHSSISGQFDIGGKASLMVELLVQSAGFTVLAGAALVIGSLRNWTNQTAVTTSVLFISIAFFPAALFTHSHDAMLLAALSGAGIVAGFSVGAPLSARLLAVLYATSMVAGAVMAVTATYGLYSFPVGGALAGILAVTSYRQILPSVCVLAAFIWGSTSLYYGEWPDEAREGREWVTHGVFAGLKAKQTTARIVREADLALNKYSDAGDTIAVVGRLSGLYLLTPARPRALMPFALTTFASRSGLLATYRYYAASKPTVVATYEDQYFAPINPFGASFDEWYELVDRRATPPGTLSIYRRREAAGGG
jgi:hypothetical protein